MSASHHRWAARTSAGQAQTPYQHPSQLLLGPSRLELAGTRRTPRPSAADKRNVAQVAGPHRRAVSVPPEVGRAMATRGDGDDERARQNTSLGRDLHGSSLRAVLNGFEIPAPGVIVCAVPVSSCTAIPTKGRACSQPTLAHSTYGHRFDKRLTSYSANLSSTVIRVRPSTRACAMSIRSNGSA
jgi:hypothetical protein